MPALPVAETGWNATALIAEGLKGLIAMAMREMISAEADGIENPVEPEPPAGADEIFGSQAQTSGWPASSPERSTIRAPLRLANGRFVFVKADEPVKKMTQALSKLSSSTGWMTAASPPASVSVPAA